jgi:hypothetical protein
VGERLDRTVRAAAVGAGLLGLLAVVALASGNGRPRVGGTTDIAAVANVRDIVVTVGVTVYVFGIGLVLWAMWGSRMRGGKLDRPSGIGSLLVFFALAAALAYGINNQPEPQQPLDEIPLGPGEVVVPPRIPQVPEANPVPPAQFRWELAAGLTAAGAAAVGAVLLLRRRRGEDAELEPLSRHELAAAELAAVVEGTLDDLRREADPRRAVIAAYAQMERVLKRHGLPRHAAEAPFEYLTRLLAELRVRPNAALALTELFERARFSDHEIDATMKDEAIDALVSVRDDLRAA